MTIESLDRRGAGGTKAERMRVAPPLWVDPGDAAVLHGWLRDPTEPALARRARIVLLCRDGHGPSAVSLRLGCAKQTVISWRERYRREGLDGLRDAPRSGRPTTVNPSAVVLATLQPPDPVGARWSTRSLGAALGISNVAVANIWREWGIRAQVGGRVSLRTDPALEAVVVDVVGLHVDPPVFLFAVAVDQQPGGAAAEFAVPGPPDGPRPALGGMLADLVLAAQSETGDRVALGAFLNQLDRARDHHAARDHNPVHDQGAVRGVTPHAAVTTAVVAAGDTASVGAALAVRGSVSVHAAASVAGWERMVRVGCLLAGADPAGAASVEALRKVVRDHGAGPFSWIRT